MKHTITLLVVGAVLAYGANGYVDIDKLDRHNTPSQASKKSRHPMVTKNHAKRRHKHPRARSPEALLKTRTHKKRHMASRHLGQYGYDRWNAPEAMIESGSHPHRRFRRGWVLAYRYDKATFVDRYGYRYDWFDRFGFTFEGYYFPYNARYRYRDRLRGRGYFDRYYYAPLRARYYGFCP